MRNRSNQDGTRIIHAAMEPFTLECAKMFPKLAKCLSLQRGGLLHVLNNQLR